MYSENYFLDIVNSTRDIEIIYSKNKVYIIRVKSFKACNRLFCNEVTGCTVNWCIANHTHHWYDYVEHPDNYQYFIVDYNHINDEDRDSHNESLIGFTLDKHNNLYAAHARNDDNLLLTSSRTKEYIFYDILKQKKLYDFVVKYNMSTEKMQEKLKEKKDRQASLVPFYIAVGLILLIMCTLFIR